MTTGAQGFEIWRVRVSGTLATQVRRDAEMLGLQGCTQIVRAALELLHRSAAEERMARSVEDFYGSGQASLPLGLRRNDAPEPVGMTWVEEQSSSAPQVSKDDHVEDVLRITTDDELVGVPFAFGEAPPPQPERRP